MAYVAISKALIDDTERNINNMRDKEKATIPEVPNEIRLDPADHLVIDMAWGANKDLRARLEPLDDWIQPVDSIAVYIQLSEVDKKASFYIRSSGDRFRVPNYRSNGYNNMVRTIDETHSFAQIVAAAYLERYKQLLAIDAKWKEIREQVNKFLNASKSLNEALKLWPALSLYVSSNYINRVNEAVTRNKTASDAEAILASMKTDEMTAAAVNVKLAV